MGETPQFEEEELKKLSLEQLEAIHSKFHQANQDKFVSDDCQPEQLKPSKDVAQDHNHNEQLIPSDGETDFARATDVNFDYPNHNQFDTASRNLPTSRTKRSINIGKKKKKKRSAMKSQRSGATHRSKVREEAKEEEMIDEYE